MKFRSINPYNGEINGDYNSLSDKELRIKLDEANKAFLEWSIVSIRERAGLLINLADLLEKEKALHSSTITSEMGKPISQSIAEVEKCAQVCRYYAANGEAFLSQRLRNRKSHKSKITFDPLGLVFAIMPWNFPYWQVIRCIAPAIMAGNGVLLKHAVNVPISALNIEKAVNDSGFTRNILTNLFISHKQTDIVLESSFIGSVSLTGSNIAGESVAARAGASIKRCVLELGGSDPFIVFEDANLEKAADGAIIGRFQNNGQSCIAAKRLFVHESVYPQFIHLLRHRIELLKVGDPMEMDTYIGPIVNEEAVHRLSKQVSRSVEMGAEIFIGGGTGTPGRCFFEPTILLNVPFNSPVSKEETFGPVLPVFVFNNYEDLISRVNDSVFGLGSSVWTENGEIIEKISKDIQAGTVSVNGYTRSDPELPFGGIKSSGYGRELSEFGIMEFVNVKTISYFDL